MDATAGKRGKLVLNFLPRIDDCMKVVQKQTPFLLTFKKSMMYGTKILYSMSIRNIRWDELL